MFSPGQSGPDSLFSRYPLASGCSPAVIASESGILTRVLTSIYQYDKLLS